MWMWPLDSAMGATAAHRALEGVADETCTRVWAWMIDKCRRRMNKREQYITTEITQRKGKMRKKAERKEKGSWDARGVGSSRPRARGLSPWDVGPSDSMYFLPPKQAVVSSKPNFWTHSLQIHCNEPDPKTETLQIDILIWDFGHDKNRYFYILENPIYVFPFFIKKK